MTATKAKATGRVVRKPIGDSARCTGWDLEENPYGECRVGTSISKKHGVAMIVCTRTIAGVRTRHCWFLSRSTRAVATSS